MPRTVFCRKYRKELEGLPQPPLPGAKGELIFETVSRRAWEEWQALQTMLINERNLRLIDPGGTAIPVRADGEVPQQRTHRPHRGLPPTGELTRQKRSGERRGNELVRPCKGRFA